MTSDTGRGRAQRARGVGGCGGGGVPGRACGSSRTYSAHEMAGAGRNRAWGGQGAGAGRHGATSPLQLPSAS